METKIRYLLNNQYFETPLPYGKTYLIQIGRRYCSPAEQIPTHAHLNWYELTIILGGKGKVITNGEECSVHSGDIYLSFPCDIHAIQPDEDSTLEFDFFSFYCEDEDLKSELRAITQNFFGAKSRVFQDENIVALVKNAITEFSMNDQPYTNELLADIFHLIVVYLIRNFKQIPSKSSSVSEAEILCFQLTNYIDTHIYTLDNLQKLAPKFNYNYGYLSGLFKRTTGKTLSEYFHHRKLETAKALILEKKKKIGEIANMLHYSLYAFSKAFKAKYGVSPKALQMKNT